MDNKVKFITSKWSDYMTEIGVKKTIARLITDEQFKKDFHANPKEAIEASGYSLNENEIAAIEKIKPEDLAVKYSRTGSGIGNKATECTVGSIKSFKNRSPATISEKVNR